MSVMIIAEAGINHNRSISEAIRLVDTAKICGADVVKFQLESPTEYCLSYGEMEQVYRYCKEIEMPFACTAFDVPTLEFLLKHTKMEFIKIASRGCDNLGLLKLIGDAKLPVICSMREGDYMIERVSYIDLQNIIFLHCVGEYPTPIENAKLSLIKKLPGAKPAYGYIADKVYNVGLSDHSGNPLLPALAIALGATVIECHLTMDRNQPGPDHKASLDPAGFKQMVEYVRMAEKAL